MGKHIPNPLLERIVSHRYFEVGCDCRMCMKNSLRSLVTSLSQEQEPSLRRKITSYELNYLTGVVQRYYVENKSPILVEGR